MLIKVKEVQYLSDYKLRILFTDEKVKIIDFRDWIHEGGVYLLPLKDIEYFKKVRMDRFNYTICWPNGADFCPDVLYSVGKDEENLDKSPSPKKRSISSISRRTKRRTESKSNSS